MGTWGTSLFANDSASDIRGEYIDSLRRGKTNEEITEALINHNQDIMGDVDEEPIFWFALADTQWNYGRLLPSVKEKALQFISQNLDNEIWKEAGENQLKEWQDTLKKLKNKLLSPPPPIRKVSAYRLYKCKWSFGDVFAYRLCGEYSKEKGFYGQYIVFRKVTENIMWPGHIVPTVHIYNWIGTEIPSLEQIEKMELLPSKFWPIAFVKYPNMKKEYLFDLLTSSEKSIPKDKLTFLANLKGNDLFTNPIYNYPEQTYYVGYAGIEWKNFEKVIIDQYLAWNT